MLKKQVSHNHHYVPRFILKGFLGDGDRLWVYDTKANTIESSTPKASGAIRNLYAIKKADGTTDYSTIENAFDREFENSAASVLTKILKHQNISSKEAFNFIKFVAAQLCRTPAFFDRTSQTIAPGLEEMYRRIQKDPSFRVDVTPKLIQAGASEEEIDEILTTAMAKPDKQFVMLLALKQVETIAHQFSQMNWCFMDVPPGDPDLIIGDHPVILFDDGPDDGGTRTLGIKNPHIEIAIPLSKRMAAFARWHGPVSYGELLPGSVNTINLRTLYQAQQFVFASINSSELLADALKVKGMGPKVHIRRVEIDGRHMIIKEYY